MLSSCSAHRKAVGKTGTFRRVAPGCHGNSAPAACKFISVGIC